MSKAEEIAGYESLLREHINQFIYGELTESPKRYIDRITQLLMTLRQKVSDVAREETFFDHQYISVDPE